MYGLNHVGNFDYFTNKQKLPPKQAKTAHHLPGIVVKTVGTNMDNQGRLCKEHNHYDLEHGGLPLEGTGAC